MRLLRARSTLAPKLTLLMVSFFCSVGTNLCSARGLFSSRSRPCDRFLISCMPVSVEAVETLLKDGEALYVLKRTEARFEDIVCRFVSPPMASNCFVCVSIRWVP